MTIEEDVYKTIRIRSNFLIKKGDSWKKQLSSAKNYISTPDLKHWTFGKSAGPNKQYHADGGAAKQWLYSIGFLNVLELPDSNFRNLVIDSFLNWTTKVPTFDINKKFKKDQSNNKRFEILVHNTIVPESELVKSDISMTNQTHFDEGFKKEITREIAKRDKKVIELAKIKHGTKCSVCKFDFGSTYGLHGSGFIEMHHLDPISLGQRKTTVDDLSPVCSNCHRMLHKGQSLLSINQLKEIIKRIKNKA